MVIHEIQVRPVEPNEEENYQLLMQKHHYLGALPKIGENLWYVATYHEEWLALLGFSSAALKCAVRDQWIGWDSRHQYDRLNLVTNNSRFLILPQWHRANVASRVLSLCRKRLPQDWQDRFGHPLLLLETFVDPTYFHGTLYQASNWIHLGNTKGFNRTRKGYSSAATSPKMVFVRSLQRNARKILSSPRLEPAYRSGASKMMLTAEQMWDLPKLFVDIPDPRRAQGRRHRLTTILAITAGAILCGCTNYQAVAHWADRLSATARERFSCRWVNGRRLVPSESIIRRVLSQVNPLQINQALQPWNQTRGQKDESLLIDAKSLCNLGEEERIPCSV